MLLLGLISLPAVNAPLDVVVEHTDIEEQYVILVAEVKNLWKDGIIFGVRRKFNGE